jgi:hypothetical protein
MKQLGSRGADRSSLADAARYTMTVAMTSFAGPLVAALVGIRVVQHAVPRAMLLIDRNCRAE